MNLGRNTTERLQSDTLFPSRDRWLRWLIPVAGILALVGYFGPWIPHASSGLTVTGLDLGEYVKFLPAVRNGQIGVWREGFYLPLMAVSVSFSLLAFRPELAYGGVTRGLLLVVAGVAALNLLPPAWTPSLLATSEFLVQTVVLLLCWVLILFSPIVGRIPRLAALTVVSVLCIAAVAFTAVPFMRLLPSISGLYAKELQPGWGLYLLMIGLASLASAIWLVPYAK